MPISRSLHLQNLKSLDTEVTRMCTRLLELNEAVEIRCAWNEMWSLEKR